MPNLDWLQCPATVGIPGKRGGAWVFRGTRTPIATVFENLQELSVGELVEEFGVTLEQVEAVLQFAAHSTEAPRATIDARSVRRIAECRGGRGVCSFGEDGQEYPISPNHRGPRDSPYRIGSRTSELYQALHRANQRGGQCGQARHFVEVDMPIR